MKRPPSERLMTMAEQLRGLIAADKLLTQDTAFELSALVLALAVLSDELQEREMAPVRAVPVRFSPPEWWQ